MLEFIDQKVGSEHTGQPQCTDDSQRTELQLFGSEQNMSTLQDLSNLLYTRGRLQELGCTFTIHGELSTFGNPTRLQEFEQLLRLGPIYDEQWMMFFNKAQAAVSVEEAMMWSDMRTLKRVLTNEGVVFGADHQRMNHGAGSAKLFRLCAAYDDLHKLWSAAIPARTLTPIPEREQDDSIDDSGCYMDEEVDGLVEGVDDLPVEARSVGELNDSTVSLPRNIGWRFSDDITPLENARNRTSMSDDGLAGLEADVAAAVAVRRPSMSVGEIKSKREESKGSSRSSFKTRLRHGPYPLQVSCGCTHKVSAERLTEAQNVATTGVEPGPETKTESRGNHIGSHGSKDTMSFAKNSATSLRKSAEAKGEGKKSRKGWWRGMFGRTSDQTANKKHTHVGGWW
ncbi:hypothetical protein BDU57DRAFT_555858 [Ampelomyces quisqualis]|uniref:Uncharacterized protein n=1 Tax=Ampelomyces quisqualis TaxID=50730 RepID=A0A6A5QTP3_AMPQU|nr:hypothetical protein BDU57DRAFT_555858 [Ampelomyces quisqualis]